MPQQHDPRLARQLILDELFDLSLYKALREIIDGKSRKVLDELVLVETQHLAFWQKFFDLKLTALDLPRRLKLQCMILLCRLFGSTAVHLVLEAIEVHGVRKYLSLWKSYQGQPLGHALEDILLDEFKHEDVLVTQLTERKINPEKIRNIFLGMNDGLVEILGAVSGFFAAFGDAATVLIAASTTAVAGSLSMGAGIYVAISSEKEVQQTESDRQQFLKAETVVAGMEEQPLASALVVGGSYIAGAMVPVLPVLFGAKDALPSLLTAGSMIILVSMVLAFLSGMDIKKRILTNLVIIACAVAITYAIGLAAKALWGVVV
ncbi:MAG: VIT1/CCC1 transporter family protein [Nitrospirales bacterium]|nr:VIT1/CCC1 transporter family protein [Nitrospirales bacterium]